MCGVYLAHISSLFGSFSQRGLEAYRADAHTEKLPISSARRTVEWNVLPQNVPPIFLGDCFSFNENVHNLA